MGVKDVWHIAGPFEERISLREDRPWLLTLRAWLSRITPGMQFTVTRPHLRNLYFRINALLSLAILPVVLGSSVPDLKKSTVAARPSGAEARQQRRQFSGYWEIVRGCSPASECRVCQSRPL